MNRIALLPSEPIRARMAGIGIRYLELARRLPAYGLNVALVTSGEVEEAEELLRQPGATSDGKGKGKRKVGVAEVLPFERGNLAQALGDCAAVVTQGQLANDVALEIQGAPVVIDLYDPFLIENFHYYESLGLDPYRNDHASWVLQLSRGDFFLCSSEEQRRYYLGFLTALGRVNPRRALADPDLLGLVAPVPFGVPSELPPYEPYLPPAEGKERRLLFGGLYDWYDPWPVLEAIHRCPDEPWVLLLIRNPNPGTPQKLFEEVETWCRERGIWETRVRALDWVPSERRYDLLRDVDLVVATHQPTLETRLSLRTRFLDALAAGCPVITTQGGAISRLLTQHEAGWVVAEGDADAVIEALRQALVTPNPRQAGAHRLVETFAWDRVLVPLVDFCRAPRADPWRKDFTFRPTTQAPPDRWAFRLRRKLRRILAP